MRFNITSTYTFIIITITVTFLGASAFVAAESLVDQRINQEVDVSHSRFAIIPHKPTYILPFVFNDKIQQYSAYRELDGFDSQDLQQVEMKFQISFKVPIISAPADLPMAVFFGYTQASYWQAYNTDQSSPFRETNYEPEIFALWRFDDDILSNWTLKLASVGFAHQSNGQSDPLSRSWNRVEGEFVLENDNLVVTLNPWYRFKENEQSDNNPDLLDYYGHGQINAIYKIRSHTINLISRNNLESAFSKGSVQLSWSFPIHNKWHGYIQVFSGYGNSLIEYNEYTNTIGLGISLTDWL